VIEVTKTQVIDAVAAVVNERPEYVYANPAGKVAGSILCNCYYVHRDAEGNNYAGCLVGAVLERLGVALTDILECGNSTAAREVVPQLLDLGNRDDNSFAVDYLGYLQGEQDNGATWGAALMRAEAAFELVTA
jgi:hypothetical protein